MVSSIARAIVFVLALTTALWLSACGSSNGKSAADSGGSGSPTAVPSASASVSGSADAGAVRSFTDVLGRTVEIPQTPRRVVYAAPALGDALAVDAPLVGIIERHGKDKFFPDQTIEDVGEPANAEKVSALEPDLIVIPDFYALDGEAEQLGKIAPVVVINSNADALERFRNTADLLGKKAEGERWIGEYVRKLEKMWQRLLPDGAQETAAYFMVSEKTIFLNTGGLASLLYQPGGFAPPNEATAESFRAGDGGFEVSVEKFPDYLGDRNFILTFDDEASKQTMQELSKITGIPADGFFYVDSKWNANDPLSLEAMLEELPKLLGK